MTIARAVPAMLAAFLVAGAAPGGDTDQPAWRATHGVLLSIARAGDRMVATGDRGTILLSDDGGAHWTVTHSGTDALLTASIFTSPIEGWVVGQDATILHTQDAGAHWVAQNHAAGSDQALFSVAYLGPGHLIASGAYALMLETTDAGASWTSVKLPNLDEDYHLNCVLAHGGDVVVVGEAGHAFVRHGAAGNGAAWTPMPVPYEGSQFGCLTDRDGRIYSFGLRGSLFVWAPAVSGAPAASGASGAPAGSAPPAGSAWTRIETGEQRTIFGGTVLSDGTLLLVGSNGLMLRYDPRTRQVHAAPSPTGATLSGVAETPRGQWLVVGEDGVHTVDPASAGRGGELTQ